MDECSRVEGREGLVLEPQHQLDSVLRVILIDFTGKLPLPSSHHHRVVDNVWRKNKLAKVFIGYGFVWYIGNGENVVWFSLSSFAMVWCFGMVWCTVM